MGNCLSWCELLGRLSSHKSLHRTYSFHSQGLSYKHDHRREHASYFDSLGKITVLDRKTNPLEVYYDLGSELGRGQFGLIRLCTNKHTGEQFACKSIEKSTLVSAADVADVRREIRVMERLVGHPNVVELKAVYEDEEWVHLVMELCEGGELFDYIAKRKTITEDEAAHVCKTLMQVLQYCHGKGVIHRDLKPENILLARKDSLLPIKVADFGLAINTRHGAKFSGMAGSAYYIAPEVLKGEYGQEIDVWSAGVILYILLSGVPPFWDDTEDGIFEAIRSGYLDLFSNPWPGISSAAKDLLKGMLCSDVKKRLTPDQVLNHRWILRHCSSSNVEFPLTLPSTNTPFSWNTWQLSRTPSESSGSSFSSERESSDDEELVITSSLEDCEVGVLKSTSPLKTGAVCYTKECADASPKCVNERLRSAAGDADLNVDSRQTFSIGISESKYPKFERWTSQASVMEPTFTELLTIVIADLEHLSIPSTPETAEVQIQEGCMCTISKSSWAKDALLVNAFNRSFLVVHDREQLKIGWKQIEKQDQDFLCSSSHFGNLMWSSYPGSLAGHSEFFTQEAVC